MIAAAALALLLAQADPTPTATRVMGGVVAPASLPAGTNALFGFVGAPELGVGYRQGFGLLELDAHAAFNLFELGVLGGALALQGALPWPPAPAPGWMLGALGMGLVFVAGNLALQYGASHLPVNTASVVMLTEVLFAAASAVWWGGEVLHSRLLLGGALIMGSAALAAWQSWAGS